MAKPKGLASKRPTCLDFGAFNHTSEKCAKCPQNLDCFKETMSSEKCFFEARWDSHDNKLVCENTCYDSNISEKCKTYMFIMFQRESICEKFGKPTVCKDCVLCNAFGKCEAAEICISNLSMSLEEAKEIIDEQKESFISEAISEEDECFGRFSFEECWDVECEFKIECLRKMGIIPDGSCIHFPLSADLDIDKSLNCTSCRFKPDCKEIWTSKRGKIIYEEKQKKIYNRNLSVSSLRELLSDE